MLQKVTRTHWKQLLFQAAGMFLVVFFVMAGLLVTHADAESPPYEDNYGGVWRTDWEDFMFSMDYEGHVRGAYDPRKSGRFVGVVRVDTMHAAWAADVGETRCPEPRWGSPYWGEVVITFDYGAEKLQGVWGACGTSPDKSFTGRRLSPMEMNADVKMPAGKPLPEAPTAQPLQQAQQTAPAPAQASDTGSVEPPADFPKMPQEFPVGSTHPDPVALLLPDTALDTVLLNKVWELDALVDRAPEKALPVGWVYRTAYASYLPLNESGPMVDMRVFTGQEPALKMLENTGHETLSNGAPATDIAAVAFRGQENGRSVLWFRIGEALVRVSAPDSRLADQFAKLVQQGR